MTGPLRYGKYLLLERVNVGGMAEVFKAKAFGVEGFERLVAVKRILPAIAENDEFTTMFIDEAKIAVQLTHANIAQIFDLGRVGDSFYIAMEYVHGRDLRAIFDRCRRLGESVPIPMACFVTMQVCEGLDYAHNQRDRSGRELNLVHRDVSPQNVLVSNDGEVKLIDFGVAKAAGRSGTTQSGILKGKFGYMSPEQVRGEPVDRRSDVFAVGICLYEMLTGERLFAGASDFSTLEKVRTVDVVPPSERNPAVQNELERIVMRALARDPDERYASAMELHDELQSFMYTSGTFFARKDLRAFMHELFAEEIAREYERDKSYRSLELVAANVSIAPGAHDHPTRAVVAQPDPAHANGEVSRVSSTQRTGVPPPLPPPRPGFPENSTVWPPPAVRAAAAAALPVESVDDRISTTTYERPEPENDALLSGSIRTGGGPPGHALPPAGASPGSAGVPFQMPFGSAGAVPLSAPPSAGPPIGATSVSAVLPHQAVMGSVPLPSGSENAGVRSPFSVVLPPPDPIDRPPSQPREDRGKKGSRMSSRSSSRRSRRRRSRFGPILLAIAFSLLCLLGAAAAVYFFLAPAEPGVVVVTTAPADATVLFDERRIDDARSPFVIEGVEPRMNHLLQVQRAGYRPYSQRVRVGSGETLELDKIRLEEVDGPLPLVGTGFTLSTEPAGARVYVDGAELPSRTPVQVTDLEPGNYSLRVEHGSRYEPWESEIGVGPDEIVQLPRVTLRLQSVSVQFRSEPPGAAVTLIRGNRRRAIGSTPTNADVALNGSGWTVEMTRRGYEAWSEALDPPGGRDEFVVRARLRPASSPVAVPSSPRLAPRPPPSTTVRHAAPRHTTRVDPPERRTTPMSPIVARPAEPTTSAAVPPVTPSVAEVAEAAAAHAPPASAAPGDPAPDGSPWAPPLPADTGTLQVNSVPWSQVYVNDSLVGNTPQMSIALPPGRHRVRLENPDFNVSHTIGVTIRAGESIRRVVRLPVGE